MLEGFKADLESIIKDTIEQSLANHNVLMGQKQSNLSMLLLRLKQKRLL